MLVISRKNGQKIMINDNIEITIVESKNGVCKVAIQADKDVKIYREEVYLQIKLANMIGTNTKPSAVDSVSDLLKNKSELNSKIDSTPDGEMLIDDKKSIRIDKNIKNDKNK